MKLASACFLMAPAETYGSCSDYVNTVRIYTSHRYSNVGPDSGQSFAAVDPGRNTERKRKLSAKNYPGLFFSFAKKKAEIFFYQCIYNVNRFIIIVLVSLFGYVQNFLLRITITETSILRPQYESLVYFVALRIQLNFLLIRSRENF